MTEYIDRDGMPIKKGLVSLLEYLSENEIKFTVATSSHENTARHYFEKAGISHYFEKIMSGEKVEKGKPDPQIYLRAAELLQLEAKECVVLEDSLYGIESAHRAGMTPIMVPDLIRPTEEAKNMAFCVVEDLQEAKNVIKMLTEVE